MRKQVSLAKVPGVFVACFVFVSVEVSVGVRIAVKIARGIWLLIRVWPIR